ncbi:MAG: hypothetical protein AB7E24_25270 [Novosphingobium sp.]
MSDLVERLRDYAEHGSLPWVGIADTFSAAAARIEQLEAENARLLKLTAGQWFYPGGGHDSDRCMWSPDEVIDWLDLEPGNHVVEVDVATPLPAIWCAVHVTDDEDADERFTFTEHESEEAALAALAETGG